MGLLRMTHNFLARQHTKGGSMTQHEALLWEMEKRGGRISTTEILSMTPRIAQYNRVICDLRKKGYVISCLPILNQPGNNLFTLQHDPRKKHSQLALC